MKCYHMKLSEMMFMKIKSTATPWLHVLVKQSVIYKRECVGRITIQSSIFPCYCNSENHIEYKNILIFIIQCNLDCSILIDWWLHHWQDFVSSVCKTKRSHVSMCPLTNKSQKMSKGLKNIKCQSFVLTTFWNDLRSTEQTYSMQHGSIC